MNNRCKADDTASPLAADRCGHRMTTSTTLYLRILVPFAATILVAMLLAWWAATALLSGALEARVHQQLDHTTATLAEGVFPLRGELLEQLSVLQDAEFALIRRDGTIGTSTFDAGSRTRLAPRVEQAWAGADASTIDGYDLVFRKLRARRAGDHVAIAGLASLADAQAAARRTALVLGLLTLGGVAVVGWLGHRLSNAVTRPVRALGDMARAIAAGDRSVQADVPPVREIADLARALNDMTGRLDAYEHELSSASRLAGLGQIAAQVAHEIRNPLTAMKLQMQVLCEQLPASSRSVAEGLLREIQRLELIVSSTLVHGRAITVAPRRCHLNAIVEETLTLVSPQFSHRRIDVQPDFGELPAQPLDADRIKQVLFNLLTNAADALPDGGRVRVGTGACGGMAHLEVEDSGPGLADPDGVFAAPAETSKPTGLGLGLMVCREIAELHGGSIAADRSPALGGARFTVRLPLADER